MVSEGHVLISSGSFLVPFCSLVLSFGLKFRGLGMRLFFVSFQGSQGAGFVLGAMLIFLVSVSGLGFLCIFSGFRDT